jgi:hypothetical protein
MRRVLLVITLLFLAALAALTIDDIVRNGPTPIDIVSILILVFFWIAIIGALRERPPR